MSISAVLAVAILIGVTGWSIDQSFQSRNRQLIAGAAAAGDHSGIPNNGAGASAGEVGIGGTGTTSDPYAPDQITDNVVAKLADDYVLMQQSNYTQDQQSQIAQQLGKNLKANVSYKTYAVGEIPTTPDTSYAAMMAYRAALQTSFKAMMQNKEAELDYLSKYEETQDPQYLTDLQQAADNYKLSAAATAQVAVPADAVSVQIGILNAMDEFAATLSSMAQNAQDPLSEATLINTYLQAQQDMFTSFNNLYAYFKSKRPNS